MADGLRTGMDCKMLGAGSGFHNFAIALEPFYKRDSQLFRKVRIFTVSFMSPSPSWITENIYVWRPEGKTFVNVTVFFLGICIVFGTTFGSNGICNLSQKFGVKSGAKSNCLRENCGLSGAGNSVERFIPPVVGGDAKPLDCRCVIA